MNKKDLENFDFIKQKFDAAALDSAENLDENIIKNKLSSLPQQEAVNKNKRIPFRAAVSAAACFALILSVMFAYNPKNSNNDNYTDLPAGFGNVATFNNYDEVYDYIAAADARAEEIRKEKEDQDFYASGISDSSSTYVQVDGIDEADIVKVYNGYIYTYDDFDVLIYKAIKGKAELVAKINVYDMDFGLETVVEDFYVCNDILALNTFRRDSRYFEEKKLDENDAHSTFASVETMVQLYDVSHPEKPEYISHFVQSGAYQSSRVIGNTEYLITTHYTSEYADDAKIPYTVTNNVRKAVAADDIAHVDNAESSNSTVISAIDIRTGEAVSDSKAVIGVSNNIYCSNNNLYLINYNYYGEDAHTCVIKLSVVDNVLGFVASVKIEGNILNQFSMDEKDGLFRVAVTSTEGMKTINTLYVYDEYLNLIGKAADFAEGESVQSVCFIGDMAYVVTYEKTDPLFVIDLSNPELPEIKGSVEITGFSSELVPVDDNTLLGIGYETFYNENEYIIGGGLKFALFDVSNPENPVVLDSAVLENAYSEAQYNHKAIIRNSEKGYFAFPISYEGETIIENDYNIITIKVNNGKLHFTNKFDFEVPKELIFINDFRCVYVDDYIYSVADGMVSSSFYVK